MPDATSPPIPASPHPQRSRWRPRLSLRAMMVAVVLIGGPLGWIARRAALQRRAVDRVRTLGGRVQYEDEIDAQGRFRLPHRPWGPEWLRRWVGDEPFQEVAGVNFSPVEGTLRVDDESIAVLNDFPGLRRLGVTQVGRPDKTPPPPRSITASGLARLTGVPRLRNLSLLRLDVDAEMVRLLPRWPELEEILITEQGHRTLDASALRALGRLPRLRSVQVHSVANPSAADLAPLLGLDHLEHLLVVHSPRDDAGVARLGSVPSLVDLVLPQTALTDATLAALARNANLVTLCFDGSRLSPGALRALRGLPRLQSLVINLGDRSSEPNAHHLIHRVPARFGDVDLDALPGLRLTALTIMGLDATDAGVMRLLAGRSFVQLGLSGRGITDASIPLLAQQAALRSLDLANTGITDAGVARLAALPIRNMSLVDNPAVTDAGIAALKSCPSLEYLTFRQPGTRPETIRAIRAGRRIFNAFEAPAEAP